MSRSCVARQGCVLDGQARMREPRRRPQTGPGSRRCYFQLPMELLCLCIGQIRQIQCKCLVYIKQNIRVYIFYVERNAEVKCFVFFARVNKRYTLSYDVRLPACLRLRRVWSCGPSWSFY